MGAANVGSQDGFHQMVCLSLSPSLLSMDNQVFFIVYFSVKVMLLLSVILQIQVDLFDVFWKLS